MKKILSLLLALTLIFALCSCNEDNAKNDSQNEEKPIEVVGEYTVTFDLGYENKSFTAKSKNFKIAKPTDPTRSGYKFQGWLSPNDDGLWNFTQYEIPYDTTLTAKWGKYMYHIFYSNVINGVKTQEFKESIQSPTEYGVCLEKGIAIMYDNYSVAVGEDFVNNSAGMMQNFDSYYYDVYFPKLPNSFSVDSETFTVPELALNGYSFLGWTYDGQSTPVKTVTIPKGTTEDYRLTANWEKV